VGLWQKKIFKTESIPLQGGIYLVDLSRYNPQVSISSGKFEN
jgi:hypothetical protein